MSTSNACMSDKSSEHYSPRESSANNTRRLERTTTDKKHKSQWKLIAYLRLLIYANPSWLDIGMLMVGVTSAVATGVPLPLLAVVFGQLIDDFNAATCSAEVFHSVNSVNDSSINGRILMVLYLAIGQFVAIYVHLICWSLIGSRLAQRTRELYLNNLLRQEPCFFDQFNDGDISSRLNGDIQAIRNGTSEKVGICISAFACLIGAYIVAFIKYPRLAGILVCLIPAYLIMSLGGGFYIGRYSDRLSEHVASAVSVASESLSHITVVHAFRANTRLESIFRLELDKAKAAGLRKAVATGVQSGLLYFIAYAANGLAFWQGSKAVAESVRENTTDTTVGRIFTVIFVIVDATVVLSQTIPLIPVFSAACVAFLKLEQEIDRKSRIDPASTLGRRFTTAKGHFELRGVSFTHPSRPDVSVLKNVSLQIPAGKHTAIVGPSGSGKSTIAGLLLRLYDANAGTILLDGDVLESLNVHDLRKHVSLAQQEGCLLDQSILENIAQGLVDTPLLKNGMSQLLKIAAQSLRNGQSFSELMASATPELTLVLQLVEDAATQADAQEFISQLKHSFGTVVGPKGQLLSGGQKQRIGLARALAKNSQIMIFDEATSALDSSTERRIVNNLKTLMSGKTVITIAHRLSTIRDADNIVVLRAGEVIEQGTHNELMTLNASYARLVQLQSFGGVAGPGGAVATDAANASAKSYLTETTELTEVNEQLPPDATVPTESMMLQHDGSVDDENAGLRIDRSLSTIWKAFGPLMRPYSLLLLPALAATTVVGAAFSIEAVIFGNTVGSLSPCKPPSAIASKGAFFGLMFFVLAVAEMIANTVSWSLLGEISDGLVRTARILSFNTLLKQDVQWHQSAKRKPTTLLNFITRDGDLLAGLSGSVLGVAVSIGINLVVSIVLTTVVAWKIALVCLAIVPLFLGIGLMQLRVMVKFEEKHENAYADSVALGIEAINNIKTIASFSLENDILASYRCSLAAPLRETTAVTFHANLWLALAYFVGNLGYALAFWWGGQQIVNGNYTQVQFLIVVFSLLVSAQLWSGMFALAPEISNARAALSRISNLLNTSSAQAAPSNLTLQLSTPSEHDIEKGNMIEKSTAINASTDGHQGLSIVLSDVTFSYPSRPNVPVLRNISLRIAPGQFCALVGSTGAGKSTVVSLIERMYTPTSGSIWVGYHDITKESGLSFRDDLAYVPQDNSLFDGTVSFNVGIGARPDIEASQAQIEEACKAAHIHETIVALPQGYQTRVGNSGGHLSGGQRQRLAIARALIRHPKVLILDEPTSALDAETESLLQETFDTIVRDTGMTIIVIAHRMKTIYRADVIYVFKQGQIVGSGTHDDLVKTNEEYKTNAAHQML